MVEQAQQDSQDSVESLVGRWLSVPEVAERLGIPLRAVRRLIDERTVLAWRVGGAHGGTVVAVPELFLKDGEVLPSIPGTLTVLADGGLNDEATLRWLFTPDESLPMPGAPIDMLQVGRKAEVRKRAMELA